MGKYDVWRPRKSSDHMLPSPTEAMPKSVHLPPVPRALESNARDLKPQGAKDSFLRALRKVAQKMELFLENHVIESIYVQSCMHISPFYKKWHLKK